MGGVQRPGCMGITQLSGHRHARFGTAQQGQLPAFGAEQPSLAGRCQLERTMAW